MKSSSQKIEDLARVKMAKGEKSITRETSTTLEGKISTRGEKKTVLYLVSRCGTDERKEKKSLKQ